MRPILSALFLVGLAAMSARADVAPVGPEFQVNDTGRGYRQRPRAAADAAGGFVVVWNVGAYYAGAGDGSSYGVFGRRFDATGAAVGSDFLVNTYTSGPQNQASVANDPRGGFVVTWGSGSYYTGAPTQDGSATGVFLQRFDAAGGRLGGEQQANTFTIGPQTAPDVAVDAAGNFVVVWTSGNYRFTQDGSREGVFGQRFDGAGTPSGSEFQVNSFTTGAQFGPAVTALSTGGFIVVWNSDIGSPPQDGDQGGIFGQRFDPTGIRAGTEFQVNTYTTGTQYGPDVAPLPTGGFVVTWQSNDYYGAGPDGDGASVAGRRFAPDGTPLGDEFQVNTYTSGDQRRPTVASDPSGNFVVTWDSGAYYGGSQDGSGRAVAAQHFAPDATPLGDELIVNTYTTASQSQPTVAADGHGNFVIAWTGYKFGDSGIFGQRFVTAGFAPPIHLTGTKLVLKDAPDPARRKLTIASRDAAISAGDGDGSIDDPTLTGGALRIRSATFDDTYALPAANWHSLGGDLGYEYRDPHRAAGPIVRLRIRRGRLLDARGQGAQLGHTLASNPRPVTITLQSGRVGQRSCVAFGGGYAFKPGRVFKATNAPAPAACEP